jgi:hypothetical protein
MYNGILKEDDKVYTQNKNGVQGLLEAQRPIVYEIA